MRIACCTMEMVALIFLLFVSINGAYSYLDNPARTDLVSKSTTELVTVWGTPTTVVTAADLGFVSPQRTPMEIWTYVHPTRSVAVRDNIVISVRWG
jgi:hypothetical protein